MERKVKERLVGAAVLMAAAIILIPEMLSGPDRGPHAEQSAQSRSDAPIKTYTIDLSQSPSAQPTPAVVENRVPPPEDLPAAKLPNPSQPGPQPGASDQAKPEVSQQSVAATPPVVEPPTPVPAPPAARPLASDAGVPTSGRWAVQIGSYAKEATAERIAKQLRDQGQSAFVMPVKSGGATLYRVRLGPMKDRASAEAALRTVKSPGATIVAHP
ncbi:MAG TPA: SPOR domain-containing protein [Steroidobacteraceae bacterium]|nr:SPOR domain-containing protein [Steroidobacteraceae bacterium]